MMDSSSLKNRHQRKLCGHCNEMLSYSAYRAHKTLYFDESEQRWIGGVDDGSAAASPMSPLEPRRVLCHDGSSNSSSDMSDVDNLSMEISKEDTEDPQASCNVSHNEELFYGEDLLDSSDDDQDDTSESEVEIIIEDSSDCEDLSEIGMEDYSSLPSLNYKRILTFIIVFLLKLRVVFNISDRAIIVLLRFFKSLLLMIGTAFRVPELNNEIYLPQTLHGCYSFLNLSEKPFMEYVVCPACNMLYNPTTHTLVLGTSNNQHSAKCSFIEFPSHPQQRFRLPCDTVLLNQVQNKSHVSFKPRKIYYYYGLEPALTILLNRPNFLSVCNSWLRQDRCEFLSDMTDGLVWKEITSSLSPNRDPTNILGLLVNVDWFQPYKHVSYSIGVIYAVIINLPRSIRYQDENVIIIGIIPGPKEPKKHINSYLDPVVNELLKLHQGLWFSTSTGKQFIRCVVTCLSSDIPATRKVAGFVGHNAKKACSRCLKSFDRVGDHINCSGFDREGWPKRDNKVHRTYAYKGLTVKTKEEAKKLEREFGARYSVLYELPYYDAIRFAVIDPMHNLFLGSAKHLMTIWKDREILTKAHFSAIQDKIEKINVPLDVGRIPYKIESGLSSLTADQWKTWTCVYSLYVLHGLLPREHLDCWWLFVQACILISQPVITHADIDRADKFLLEFCQAVEKLYGPESCTINMHLHCHLADCLHDYGPVHAMWCFSFERYNGILGSTPNNNRTLHIEKTMMKRFVQQMESQKSFPHVLKDVESFFPVNLVGSVADTVVSSDVYVRQLRTSSTTILHELVLNNENMQLAASIGQMSQHALETQELICLTQMYNTILPRHKVLHVSRLCYRFSRCTLGKKLLSSQMAKSDHSSYICANWLNNTTLNLNCRPGYVKYFLKHNISIQKENKEVLSVQTLLAYVAWYKPHPERNYLHSPVSIWYPDIEPLSAASFMPINRVACRCAQVQSQMEFPERNYNNGQVVIIIPI